MAVSTVMVRISGPKYLIKEKLICHTKVGVTWKDLLKSNGVTIEPTDDITITTASRKHQFEITDTVEMFVKSFTYKRRIYLAYISKACENDGIDEAEAHDASDDEFVVPIITKVYSLANPAVATENDHDETQQKEIGSLVSRANQKLGSFENEFLLEIQQELKTAQQQPGWEEFAASMPEAAKLLNELFE